jgi:3-oxoacyl-[acyl-carrier protein] reductase
MEKMLKDKVVVVTGAGNGIGRDFALMLAQEGAKVVVNDLGTNASGEGADVGPAQAVVNEITAAGGEAVANTDSVADWNAANRLVETALNHFGRIDGVINNAGITKDNLFMRMSDDEWSSVLEVNLTSTMRLCKGVIRGMMKARWGRIVNISSIVGATGNPGQANYAASKAGMVGMSKSIAYEVASRGITVNCVAPGFIATAMTDKLTDDQKEKINVQIPAARMGTPEEIAAAVLYLASNEAGYTTGATLHVNGGMAML